MNRILITGANGFVGRRLSRMLLDCEYLVRAAVRHENSAKSLESNEQIVVGDISQDTEWGEALNGISCVIHLAARVHVMGETVSDPLSEYRRVNVLATTNLARQAVLSGVQKFIYLSSIKVNGEVTHKGVSFTAEDCPCPIGPYAVSKHEAEQELLKISTQSAMKVVVIRSPLVYGPGVKANFLNMMKWLDLGIPLPFGSIFNKRKLVYVDNLTDFILTCVQHPAAENQIFLVGDEEDVSTTQLLQGLSRALGRPVRLIAVPMRLLEIFAVVIGRRSLAQRLCGSLQVDITKASKLLNWSPKTTLDAALEKTAKAYIEEKIDR
jgi:UDP-glucose 4-epimerase